MALSHSGGQGRAILDFLCMPPFGNAPVFVILASFSSTASLTVYILYYICVV
jgi:hypothetical protein